MGRRVLTRRLDHHLHIRHACFCLFWFHFNDFVSLHSIFDYAVYVETDLSNVIRTFTPSECFD